MSVFPGDKSYSSRGDAAILTSAVRNPMLNNAAPLALNYYYKDVDYGSVIPSRADQKGSDVIYYSPGEVNSSLDLTVMLNYDAFDRETYESWIDAAATAASLPVFAVYGPMGAAWVAVAKTAAKLITRNVDRAIDNDNDAVMTWRLNLRDPEQSVVSSGFTLLYPDGNTLYAVSSSDRPGDTPLGDKFDTEGGQFVVKERTLRWRDNPDQIVEEGDAYVLAYVNGAKIPEIEGWAAAAVTAELSQRFLTAERSGAEDALEAFKVFNDMLWLKQMQGIDRDLKRLDKTSTDKDVQAEIKDLTDKRKAALKNVQDESVRDLIEEADKKAGEED